MSEVEPYHGRCGSTMFVDPLKPGEVSLAGKPVPVCHLYTLPGWEDDLRDFAGRIGLLASWFQTNTAVPHFLLTFAMRQRALSAGAVAVDDQQFMATIRQWRESNGKCLERSVLEQLEQQRDDSAHCLRGHRFEVMPVSESEFSEEVSRLRQTLFPPVRRGRPLSK